MFVQDILRAKGKEVHTIGPEATLDDVVRELVRYNVGSLVVCETEACGTKACMATGIITERDILRAQAAHRAPLERLIVRSMMTCELITASPHDPLEYAMRRMTYHRVRHLPVIEDEELMGIISIGDIVKAHHDELATENHFLKDYIQG
jgi:CBS domain-containing protein